MQATACTGDGAGQEGRNRDHDRGDRGSRSGKPVVAQDQDDPEGVDVLELDRVVVDEARRYRGADCTADERERDEHDPLCEDERRSPGLVDSLKPVAQADEKPEEEQACDETDEGGNVQPELVSGVVREVEKLLIGARRLIGSSAAEHGAHEDQDRRSDTDNPADAFDVQ
jgi:hypothetical protein